jgi:hypothetical protein
MNSQTTTRQLHSNGYARSVMPCAHGRRTAGRGLVRSVVNNLSSLIRCRRYPRTPTLSAPRPSVVAYVRHRHLVGEAVQRGSRLCTMSPTKLMLAGRGKGSRGRDHPATRPAGTSSAAANAREAARRRVGCRAGPAHPPFGVDPEYEEPEAESPLSDGRGQLDPGNQMRGEPWC